MCSQRLHWPGLTPAYGLRRAKVVFGNAFGSFHISYNFKVHPNFSRARSRFENWQVLLISNFKLKAPKFWRPLNMLYVKITKSVSKGDFGPAKAAGRSQIRPVEPLGIDLVYRYIDRHPNFCYSLQLWRMYYKKWQTYFLIHSNIIGIRNEVYSFR